MLSNFFTRDAIAVDKETFGNFEGRIDDRGDLLVV
jgi:hypothetical protein